MEGSQLSEQIVPSPRAGEGRVGAERRAQIDVPALRRDEFPVTERWAWFNHATYSPPPRRAVDAAIRFLTTMSRGELPEGGWSEGIDRARVKAGRLVGCLPDDVAFLKSAAEGVGVVALGLGPGLRFFPAGPRGRARVPGPGGKDPPQQRGRARRARARPRLR